MDLVELSRSLSIKIPRKILHIGANSGQEASYYERLGIRGFHVEAIESVYLELQSLCSGLRDQTAVLACLSSRPGEKIMFNIASNGGESSSLLDLGRHALEYPDVHYIKQIEVTSSAVDSLVADSGVDSDIDTIVIDVQGAELLVLAGADHMLRSGSVNTLIVEAAVVPLYEDGASYLQIASFLSSYDFHLREISFNGNGWGNAVFMKPYWSGQLCLSSNLNATQSPNLVNIAPLASIVQSSTYKNYPVLGRMPSLDTSPQDCFSFHTDDDNNPFLILDFGRMVRALLIRVFNRISNADRADSLVIDLSPDNNQWLQIYSTGWRFGGIDGSFLEVQLGWESFRSIRLSLASRNFLHLRCVEVWSPDDDLL